MDQAQVESLILATVNKDGSIRDTFEFAQAQGIPHTLVVGVVKSLLVDAFVTADERSTSFFVLSDEAKGFLTAGQSPEVSVFKALPTDDTGMDRDTLAKAAGMEGEKSPAFKNAMGACMKNKWIRLEKSDGKVYKQADNVQDSVFEDLKQLEDKSGAQDAVSAAVTKNLKRRKLISLQTRKSYEIGKGPNFATQRKKQAAGLTKEMIENGTWESETFKPYNFNTMGLSVGGGHLHPLLKARAEYRRVLFDMGFE